ncbi:MAG: family 78 glycoside hydrolase catalytic domain [Puniceicoccaceae bacterium]
MKTADCPTGLMVDLLVEPEHGQITNRYPRFSWIVNDQAPNAHQVGYQIIVGSTASGVEAGEGDLWDSGAPDPGSAWAVDGQSTHVRYKGKELESDTTYYWKVRTWNEPDDVSTWSETQAFTTGTLAHERPVDAHRMVYTPVPATEIQSIGESAWFIDFGKAAFGTIELDVEVEQQRTIEIHLGEVLLAPGRIDREPGGSRRYQMIPLQLVPGTTTYRLVIPPDERNTRDFAIHMPDYLFEVYPFRYVEIHSLQRELAPESVRQLRVHTPFDDNAARFQSSSEVLNDVWELCHYTMKATSFCGYYVDGDRERIPYEADAYINQLGHYCVDREYAMGRRTHEHLIHYPTWPTEWILDSVLIAWNDYIYTGDPSSLEFHYKNLKAKALTALAREDHLISLEGMNDDIMASIHFVGDSLEMYPKGLRNIVDWPQSERDNFDDRPMNAVVNAFHYRAVVLMEKIAEALGHADDVRWYRDRAAEIRESFHAVFFDPTTKLVLDGEGSSHSSLHANMFALAFGLVPEASMEAVLAHIQSKGMACSVYGSQFLLEALYAAGQDDYALALLTSTGERSWAHMVYDVGTTITLEAWDNRFKPNQDWNHAWGAAPANIIPRNLMGIQPLTPGFEQILIAPQPGSLKWAEITKPTIRGPVSVRFENHPGSSFQLEIETPANTVSRLLIPAKGGISNKVLVDDHEVFGVREGNFIRIDGIGSGKHSILYRF